MTRWLVNLLRDSRGSTAVEHGLVLAIVVGGVIVGVQTMDLRRVFQSDKLSSHFQQSSERPERPIDNGEKAPTIAPSALAATALDAITNDHYVLRIASGVTIAAAIGLIVVSRRRRAAAVEAPDPRQILPAKRARPARFALKRQEILRALSSGLEQISESSITVDEIMSVDLLCVQPETTHAEVVEMMKKHDVHHLLVRDDKGQLVGIVSDRDLGAAKGALASELMTPNPIVVPSTTLVDTAITMMFNRHFSSLPVVDDGKLVGILTMTDLVMMLQCSLRLLEQRALSSSSEASDLDPSQDARTDESDALACTSG